MIDQLEYHNPYVDEYFRPISVSAGIPLRSLELIFLLFLNYPLSLAFRTLPRNPTLKHVIGILLGLFEFWFCLGPGGGVHAFITSTVSFLIITFGPQSSISPIINFIWAFGYLSAAQIWRVWTNYEGVDLDWITAQMVLTMKLTTAAWDVYDGARSAQEREKELTPEQRGYSLPRKPTLLEWYGYVFFYAGFLAGPAFKLKEYINYIEMSQFNNKDCKGNIPPSTVACLMKLGESMIFLILYGLCSTFFPSGMLLKLHTFPIYLRLLYIWIIPASQRIQYYFVWLLTEGAFIANGMGYAGHDERGRITWDLMSNARPLGVELAQNAHEIVTNWNCKTQSWLKNYIYLRITPVSQKPNWVTMYGTYFISAFWHGFYSGYYLFFVSCALDTWIAKEFRVRIRPHLLKEDGSGIQPWKRIYDFFGWFFSQYLLAYFALSFIFLKWDKSIELWSSVGFIGHIILFGGLAMVIVFPRIFPVKQTKKVLDQKRH